MKHLTVLLMLVLVLPVYARTVSPRTVQSQVRADQTSVCAKMIASSVTLPKILRHQLLNDDVLLTNTSRGKAFGKNDSKELMQQSGIHFQENRGQIVDTDGRTRSDIAFIANAPGARLYFRTNGISYVFTKNPLYLDGHLPLAKGENERGSDVSPWGEMPEGQRGDNLLPFEGKSCRGSSESYRLDMTLVGSNPHTRIRAEVELPGYVNYYLAHCPNGITGVKEYSRIVYENVYDNVDLELFSSNGKMKYNFIVRPGGDASNIRINYDGASETAVMQDGALSVATPLGRIEEAVPYTYADDQSNEVPSRFIRKGNTVSFAVDEYDQTQTLVIDPWATYYGGGDTDQATCTQIDGSGNAIISGFTHSTNFPVSTGATQTSHAGQADVFLVKFDMNGTRLWSTYYGGSGSDGSGNLFYRSQTSVDQSSNIVLVGFTNSSDFPVTSGAFQTNYAGNGDIFIVKFDPYGSRVWATYYGGGDEDGAGVSVATDSNEKILLTGSTNSSDFPVSPGAFQTTHGRGGGTDCFVVKLNGDGSRSWATYYGGNKGETAFDIAVDGNGNSFITGYASTNFPVTTGAFQTSFGGGAIDGFIVGFSSSGSRLWATYCGGSSNDYTRAIAVDLNGNILITGWTMSSDYPVTSGAFQVTPAGGIEAFIAKFTNTGTRLWASYFGGSANDSAYDVRPDNNGNILLSGQTSSTNFPVSSGAFQTSLNGNDDAFIVKMNASGDRLWATYYGGNDDDRGWSVSPDANGNVILSGATFSTNLPTLNPFQSSKAAGSDAFIVFLNSNGLLPGHNIPPVAVASATPTQGTPPLSVNFSSAGSYDPDGTISSYSWDFGDSTPLSSDPNPSHTYQSAGTYTAVLTVTDNGNATANASVTITVLAANSYVWVSDQVVTRVQTGGNKWKGKDVITIRDGSNQLVSGAVVTASYSGPNSGTVSGTTGANGTVMFETSQKPNPSGLWCFTVTDVQKSGYTFNTSVGVLTACEGTPKVGFSLPTTIDMSVYPNPFNPSTTISYSIPEDMHIRLSVYDAIGREVDVLLDGEFPMGRHQHMWYAGHSVSGIYTVLLQALDREGKQTSIHRQMTLLK